MKKVFGIAAIFLAIVAGVYFLGPAKEIAPFLPKAGISDSSSNPAKVSPSATANVNLSAAPNPLGVPAAQPQPTNVASNAGQLVMDSNAPADLPPETVLQNVGRAVHQYGEMFGGNPVGTNPEITSQLAGDNPKHINFIAAQPGTHINDTGELVDAWGTPYFFHQISGSEMEIHSAGPDKVMWSADDLVVK